MLRGASTFVTSGESRDITRNKFIPLSSTVISKDLWDSLHARAHNFVVQIILPYNLLVQYDYLDNFYFVENNQAGPSNFSFLSSVLTKNLLS